VSDNDFVLVSDEEAVSFGAYAENGPDFDPSGEGVGYRLVQPYDLGRMAHTIIELRKAVTDGRRTALLDAAKIVDDAREDVSDLREVRDRIRALVA